MQYRCYNFTKCFIITLTCLFQISLINSQGVNFLWFNRGNGIKIEPNVGQIDESVDLHHETGKSHVLNDPNSNRGELNAVQIEKTYDADYILNGNHSKIQPDAGQIDVSFDVHNPIYEGHRDFIFHVDNSEIKDNSGQIEIPYDLQNEIYEGRVKTNIGQTEKTADRYDEINVDYVDHILNGDHSEIKADGGQIEKPYDASQENDNNKPNVGQIAKSHETYYDNINAGYVDHILNGDNSDAKPDEINMDYVDYILNGGSVATVTVDIKPDARQIEESHDANQENDNNKPNLGKIEKHYEAYDDINVDYVDHILNGHHSEIKPNAGQIEKYYDGSQKNDNSKPNVGQIGKSRETHYDDSNVDYVDHILNGHHSEIKPNTGRIEKYYVASQKNDNSKPNRGQIEKSQEAYDDINVDYVDHILNGHHSDIKPNAGQIEKYYDGSQKNDNSKSNVGQIKSYFDMYDENNMGYVDYILNGSPDDKLKNYKSTDEEIDDKIYFLH